MKTWRLRKGIVHHDAATKFGKLIYSTIRLESRGELHRYTNLDNQKLPRNPKEASDRLKNEIQRDGEHKHD